MDNEMRKYLFRVSMKQKYIVYRLDNACSLLAAYTARRLCKRCPSETRDMYYRLFSEFRHGKDAVKTIATLSKKLTRIAFVGMGVPISKN